MLEARSQLTRDSKRLKLEPNPRLGLKIVTLRMWNDQRKHRGALNVKYCSLLAAVVLVAASSGYLCGQTSASKLHVEHFMTTAEMRATGIAQLTPAQREALDDWLTKYTLRIIEVSLKPKLAGASSGSGSGAYGGVGSGHWISSNDSDGAVITLEDGSVWQISSGDQIDTALWLPITDITVVQATSPVGEYKYELIDAEDHEKASAKYIGIQ